jgi:hypothetical protein
MLSCAQLLLLLSRRRASRQTIELSDFNSQSLLICNLVSGSSGH